MEFVPFSFYRTRKQNFSPRVKDPNTFKNSFFINIALFHDSLQNRDTCHDRYNVVIPTQKFNNYWEKVNIDRVFSTGPHFRWWGSVKHKILLTAVLFASFNFTGFGWTHILTVDSDPHAVSADSGRNSPLLAQSLVTPVDPDVFPQFQADLLPVLAGTRLMHLDYLFYITTTISSYTSSRTPLQGPNPTWLPQKFVFALLKCSFEPMPYFGNTFNDKYALLNITFFI